MERSYMISALLLSTMITATGCAQDMQIDESREIVDDETQESNSSSVKPISQQGRMVFIDPKTGEMTSKPSEKQILRMAEARSKSASKRRSGIASAPRIMPNGTVIVELNGQFSKPIKAAIKENGQVEIGHDVDSTDN